MALRKFKCTNCEKEFTAGNWTCASGEPHTVESKIYYVLDAPADRRDCKNARLLMMNVLPERTVTEPGGHTRVIPGTHVEFARGLYETSNPQLQMVLDNRKGVVYGEEGKKLWEAQYFSNDEKREMERIRMRGEVERLQHERNALLEQVKAMKEAVPA